MKAKRQCILAIDQGTTGTTALIVDFSRGGTVLGRRNVEFPQHYPQPGWVEHDLEEIWRSTCTAIIGAIEISRASYPDFDPAEICGIGITNQRETLCVYDRVHKTPLRKAIVWQCRRSTEICEKLKKSGTENIIRDRTGLVCDPYFTGSKIAWVLNNDPDCAREYDAGRAVFSTIDTFILHRLTGAKEFKTDASNASRTLLVDISTGKYSVDLMHQFGLKSDSGLPEICDSVHNYGVTKSLTFLPDGIPITAILGDQQAALAGQACFVPGEAKCTYGTGAFLLLNTGDQNLRSKHGMLTTIAWQLHGKKTYCFEGAAFVAGAAVQFMRDQMRFIDSAKDAEDLIRGEIGAPEIYFVPALSGLGAPHWVPTARGSIFGLTRGTRPAQLVKAAIESVAFQVEDLLKAMNNDAGGMLRSLRVDGGASENDTLMQFQADVSQILVQRPKNLETTAYGVAMFAAWGAGIFSDLKELLNVVSLDKDFKPREGQFRTSAAHCYEGWNRAIQATKIFSEG